MVHIYTVDKDGYVQITKSELESLVKEAYDDGYKACAQSTISIDATPHWGLVHDPFRIPLGTGGSIPVKANEGVTVDQSTEFCKHTELGSI